MTGTIFQNPVWKNYMSAGFTNYTDEEANYMALEGTWLCETALWSFWMHVGRMMAESARDWGLSDTWQLIMQTVLLVLGTLFSSHLVCCLWFFVGRHGRANPVAARI